jgi:hypothetical protein
MGHVEIPIKLDDNGRIFSAAMVAGVIGTAVVKECGIDGHAVSPLVGWWMFTVKEGTGKKGHANNRKSATLSDYQIARQNIQGAPKVKIASFHSESSQYHVKSRDYV